MHANIEKMKSNDPAFFSVYIDARDIYLTRSLLDACQPMVNKTKPDSKIIHELALIKTRD